VRKIFIRFIVLIFCLFITGCSKKNSHQKNSKTQISTGITYQHVQHSTDPKLSIHILRIDPSKVAIRPAKAGSCCFGRETISAIANRYNALAAINGGFFEESGTPAGALKIWDYWFSDPKLMRGTMGWNNVIDGVSDVSIDRLGMQWFVHINDRVFSVSRINHARAQKKTIVYNTAFNTSTKTDKYGTEIIVQDNRIIDIQNNKGNAKIPNNGFVYSVSKDTNIDLSMIRVGMDASLEYSFVMPEHKNIDWEKFDFIVGGTPVLVSQGRVNPDFDADKILHSFIHNRHARTAVGIMPDGTWVFVVVDGKASPISDGMTIQELADFMQRFGCVKALNFDGGSSSTMWVRGKVVNTPGAHWWIFSMQGEPKVSDALLVVPR